MLFSAACTHSIGARRSPDFDQRINSIRKAALLEKVRAFEIPASGVPEQKEQWTAIAGANATRSVTAGLASAGIAAEPMAAGAESEEVDDVRALAEVVMASVMQYTYATPFPAKVKRFEYSVGPIDSLLDRSGADALVMVWGSSFAITAGRAALNILVGGPLDQAKLALALIDRSGDLIWFNVASASGSVNASSLTNPADAEALTRALLADFPVSKP
jgi:hypothetical protein